MVKKRERREKKTVRNRSFIGAFFLLSGRLSLWLIRWFYRCIRANAFLVTGLFLFAISFGFVLVNALFLQTKTEKSSFTQLQLISTGAIVYNSDLHRKREFTDQAEVPTLLVPVSSHFHRDFAKNFLESLPENLLEVQEKLAKLGLYDGPLDGLDGPKTRHAVALWKQKVSDGVVSTRDDILSNYPKDEISALIECSEMQMENDAVMTSDVVQFEDGTSRFSVAQVQEALRVFGSHEVVITGVEDQKTVDALEEFQRMFHLPITGKIDDKVLMKMREVGLLS
ncbi:peptidoglycan-binding domain-containing protein [Bartonella ancashensis]|uniref:Peptidoglycan binding domain containing protein n=1 Tax=Bartonella ancashensis TaxID=1318743 RepID=A0A0M5KST8_9HYPH|nr:peptidoglycan-binding protein [Bartonella ancashensis]ALE04036.1 Peptidoglycan binding domain containing protein [Bartonella ancashensis]